MKMGTIKKICLVIFCFLLFAAPSTSYAKRVILRVFHAGSLSVPFKRLEEAFEKRYPWIDVMRESSGSVMAVRKVIDIHKECDVIAVADYSLIPDMMFPRYADHVMLFARNELVLCYTKKSRYSKDINENNWHEILIKDGVKWGFSDPNLDPCGYRTVMCMLLAERYYKRPVAELLLSRDLPFRFISKDNLDIIEVPASFSPKGRKVFIRPKAVELLGLLESGEIDYAIEYLSVAKQHHLKLLRFPPEIDLGHLRFRPYYSKVAVVLGDGRMIKGMPIVYGMASLKNSSHPKEARLFESFVTGKAGADILRRFHQIPIYPAEVVKANE